jgi:DNA-binding NarL/FixJ family response regulator
MSEDKFKAALTEIETLAYEARVHARGGRPDIALLRISSRLSSLLISLKQEPVAVNSPFTKRENEILTYVSQGFTNRQIALAVELSEKTIEFHLASIFSKTSAASRAEAVTNALKNKWLV